MTQSNSKYTLIHARQSSVLLKTEIGAPPSIVYWGDKLDCDINDVQAAADIAQLCERQGAQGGPDKEIAPSLSCEPGTGYLGPSGLDVHRGNTGWAPLLRVEKTVRDQDSVAVHCRDSENGLSVCYTFDVKSDANVIKIHTSFTNSANTPLSINWACVLSLCLPPDLDEVISFSGRWANEFQTLRAPLTQIGFIVENRRGRTSHDRFPGLILCARNADEHQGACLGVHFGWSGNHRMKIEPLSNGRNILQIGEHFMPGEITLAAGATYETPSLYTAFSSNGFSPMSSSFHDYYRTTMSDARLRDRPRPVHYNSWEAIYFDHSLAQLKKLADEAANIGAERFVLDDGWFMGRRNDRAGLGDWQVDRTIYPNGLQPLIDYVRARKMEFGLWVEPEMVNEDSDFFRKHPDWILQTPHTEQVPFRNQFVINLTNRDAFENIFSQIDRLLSEYPDIGYIKWDMNRDINHPGDGTGHPVAHAQTRAVYALLERLRGRHPNVEFESCSSGGGRADFGILAHTDRIWTSDSNDALDRQKIQRGASYFFPLEVLGAHVGPRNCHITHRTLSMAFRAATAFFGHMGVEANLLTMSQPEKNELKRAIALHKQYRSHLHTAEFVRIDGPSGTNVFGVVCPKRNLALYSYAQLETLKNTLPGVLKFPGLDPQNRYRIKVIWPTEITTPPPHRLETSGLLEKGYEATGDALMKVGLQLPVLMPQSCIIFEVKAV